MLVNFTDKEYRKASMPYDEIRLIRQDHNSFAIVKCNDGEILLTTTKYDDFAKAYQAALIKDIQMMNDV